MGVVTQLTSTAGAVRPDPDEKSPAAAGETLYAAPEGALHPENPAGENEETPGADGHRAFVEAEEERRAAEEKKEGTPLPGIRLPGDEAGWLGNQFGAAALPASLPRAWQDKNDFLRFKAPDMEKMEHSFGGHYRRSYEAKLDRLLMYAVQTKGWDTLCVYNGKKQVDPVMTHMLAVRREALTGSEAGLKKLKAAGFDDAMTARLSALSISHSMLPAPDKRMAAAPLPQGAA
jgi:hypothetical protein